MSSDFQAQYVLSHSTMKSKAVYITCLFTYADIFFYLYKKEAVCRDPFLVDRQC